MSSDPAEGSPPTKKARIESESNSSSNELNLQNSVIGDHIQAMETNGTSDGMVDGIDENLYSRQLYVLGHAAMRRMAESDVLVSGMGGLGVEIAKNVVLAGVKSVTIQDEVATSLSDLSSQFFLREADVGKNRAVVTGPRLAELNSYVPVHVNSSKLTTDLLAKFQVVVLTNSTLEEQLEFGDFCHSHKICFIVVDTKGLFGQLFCDFGDGFNVLDTNGEQPISNMIAAITKETEGVVTCIDETRHGYETGDYVTFTEIEGMIELNKCEPRKVTVLGPYTFSIGDTTGLSDYTRGGIAVQVKMPKTVNFKSFRESLADPEFLLTDFGKFDRPPQLHIAFQALHEYTRQKKALPKPYCKTDADEFFAIAKSMQKDVELTEDLLRQFSYCAAGNLCPIQAVLGGIAAQEVMKACSGKFMPVVQWMYFDALECLPENPQDNLSEAICQPINSRYDGQIAVFGSEFQTKLQNISYFLVGAGAIGCEMLKNW